jgi:RNA polymerase sigma factor (sigma-70 family)
MGRQHWGAVIGYLQRVADQTTSAPLHDAELLERYVRNHDEAAFEVLVRRHGPLVIEVCRRVIGHEQDAENAFQVTFLLLARKARSIRRRDAIAGWLHRVALRVALRAKAAAARRPLTLPLPDNSIDGRVPDAAVSDLRRALDEAIDRLPKPYRLPFILCCVQGKTNREAAFQLGCAVGTVAARLSRARARLRIMLRRRGIALAGGSLILGGFSDSAASAAVPALLLQSTIRAALSGAQFTVGLSAPVGALVKEVQAAMLLSKLKLAGATLAGLTFLGAGAVIAGWRAGQSIEQSPPVSAPHLAGRELVAAPPERQPKPPDPAAFALAPGCRWLIQPSDQRHFPFRHNDKSEIFIGSRKPVAVIQEIDKDGGFVFTEAYVGPMKRGGGEYRPVAFDRAGKRYPFEFDGGCSGGMDQVSMARYRLDPKLLPTKEVAYLGIEEVISDGQRQAVQEISRQLSAQGIHTLPFPEVGKVYDFSLRTVDGKTIRSADLRGKVVVIDCWASWCLPCLLEVNKVKKLSDQYRAQGLEVVGISLDQNEKKMKQTCGSWQMNWPQVLVPANEKQREMWLQAADISSVPRLLLIDREGVLRADSHPAQLDEKVAELIKEAAN